MTVHFIGAGPGAPDLITIRGRDLIARCPVCLYAGSLVPEALLAYAPPAPASSTQLPCRSTKSSLKCVLRRTQARMLRAFTQAIFRFGARLVSRHAAFASTAFPTRSRPACPRSQPPRPALGQELTLPEVGQSLVLTRTPGRASAMPESESLKAFAQTKATLAIHLSIHALDATVSELVPHYGADCPVAIVYRASWPDERILRGTLSTIGAKVAENPIERTALILVGRVLADENFRESALYDVNYQRRYRGRGE